MAGIHVAPPYYAVIFRSLRTAADPDGYAAAAERMLELAAQQPGFLGVTSARDAGGAGLTVSYWRDRESIRAWREDAEHRLAQERGRSAWYAEYRLEICRVEAATEFESPRGA